LVGGLRLLLAQGDIADVAVEQLRQWKCWGPVEEVLSYYDKKSHAAPVVRRAIIRYALSCPDESKTKAFLSQRRIAEPKLVKEVEEDN
jgi:hypothetical protein